MYSIDYSNMDVRFYRGPNLGVEKIGNLSKGIEIRCYDKNHQKYYKLRYFDSHLIREWGRIGNKSQMKMEALSPSGACAETERILEDKYKKGYRLEKDKILHELGIL